MNSKRFLSIIMSSVLVLTALPLGALANTEEVEVQEAQVSAEVAASNQGQTYTAKISGVPAEVKAGDRFTARIDLGTSGLSLTKDDVYSTNWTSSTDQLTWAGSNELSQEFEVVANPSLGEYEIRADVILIGLNDRLIVEPAKVRIVSQTTSTPAPAPTPAPSPAPAPVVNKAELRAAIDQADRLRSESYTLASWTNLQQALRDAKDVNLSSSANQDAVKNATQRLVTAIVNLEPIRRTTDGTVYVSTPSVYRDRVSGYTEAGARVDLYRGSTHLGGTSADSNGYYSISHNFGYYDYPDYRDYGRSISPSNVGSRSLDGYTVANTYVYAYDEDGRYLGSDYTSNSGYYSISYSRVDRPSRIRVYRDDYYRRGDDRYYYKLSDYSLKFRATDGDTRTYSLSNSMASGSWYRDPAYRPGPRPKYYQENLPVASTVRVDDLVVGSNKISGRGATANADIVVRDNDDKRLGSTTANRHGEFTVDLTRDLKAGERIQIISSKSGYRSSTTRLSVPITKGYEYSYRNIVTIGSNQIQVEKNGVKSTRTMDVTPYIKEGRTMLPIRFVAESLGYDVRYYDHSNDATIIKDDTVIVFNIYSSNFTINGKPYTFQVQPEINNDRTMLPITEVARALGLTHGNVGQGRNIEWDEANRQVIIQVKD